MFSVFQAQHGLSQQCWGCCCLPGLAQLSQVHLALECCEDGLSPIPTATCPRTRLPVSPWCGDQSNQQHDLPRAPRARSTRCRFSAGSRSGAGMAGGAGWDRDAPAPQEPLAARQTVLMKC